MRIAGFDVPLDAGSRLLLARLAATFDRLRVAIGDPNATALVEHEVHDAYAQLVGYGLLRGWKRDTERTA